MPKIITLNAFRNIPFTFDFTADVVAGTGSDRFINAAIPWAAGDVKVSIDGGAVANIGTLPPRVGTTPIYRATLTAAEMAGTTITVYLVDADGPAWRDVMINIRTDQLGVIYSGVATAGASDSLTFPATASSVDGFYSGQKIRLVGGTGAGQSRMIVSYNGTTKVAGISPVWSGASGIWSPGGVTPDNTSQFIITQSSDVLNVVDNTEPGGSTLATLYSCKYSMILKGIAMAIFYKVTQTNSQRIVYQGDSTTALATMTVSDDGTTMTKGKAS